jgi:hypothetical protein
MSGDLSAEIPKIIWILWLQGFEAAPDLVKQCLLSWQRHNRDWKIVLLDEKNFADHININDIIGPNRQTISMQALSNIIRINLLAKFGGVWADSTCFCCRPLDEWIGNHLTSGFFAFEKPGKDRLISSWFLASGPHCHLTGAYCRAVNLYWSRNHFPYQHQRAGRIIIKWMGKILNGNTRRAGLWVHPLTAKVFQLHPYHWFHYMFYRVVTTDERSGEIWRQTPKISADIPHRLQIAGLLKPASAELKAIIDGRKDPLYKLNWRCDKDLAPGCTLDYLLNSSQGRPGDPAVI